MINGRIVCFGTPNYLLRTYGGGYEFSISNDTRGKNPQLTFNRLEQMLPGAFKVSYQGPSKTHNFELETIMKL